MKTEVWEVTLPCLIRWTSPAPFMLKTILSSNFVNPGTLIVSYFSDSNKGDEPTRDDSGPLPQFSPGDFLSKRISPF